MRGGPVRIGNVCELYVNTVHSDQAAESIEVQETNPSRCGWLYKLQPEGTIPQEVIPTEKRPDLVLIDQDSKTIDLYRLTSCADKAENIRMARQRKIIRYTPLVGDICASGWKATITPIQVCALGDIDSDTQRTFNKTDREKGLSRKLCKKLARIGISASYRIFSRRRDLEWHSPGLIEMTVD